MQAAGGQVHWARDADEANAVVAERRAGARRARGREGEVADDGRDRAERRAGGGGDPRARDRLRRADPAARRRLVVAHPRAGDPPQPLARSATSSRARSPPGSLSDDPRELAEASRLLPARAVPRARRSAISGANFGDRRDRHGLRRRVRGQRPHVHDAAAGARHVLGIEKLVPTFADLEVFLQLLPRSSTGERMNPYTSLWTGVTPATGRRSCTSCCSTTAARACSPTRSAARRCTASAAAPASTSARSTRAPAATRTARSIRGRSARSSRRSCVGIENAPSLPFASSLCGACYEVCPVKIDIPRVLLHLRAKAVEAKAPAARERAAMQRRRVDVRRPAALRARAAPRAALQRPFVAPRSIRRLPGPLAALDADPRPEAVGAAELPRVVARSGR